MDLITKELLKDWISFPHTRGDGPVVQLLLPILLSVFPTHVGMDLIETPNGES